MSSNGHTVTAITPDTTIADLLRTYPQLDEPLACLVPPYRDLPPAMRRAIGDTTTLYALATNAGVPLGGLVTALREAAGVADAAQGGVRPGWVTASAKVVLLDARPVLAAGGHPIGEVMNGLSALGTGEVLELVTPFVPAPLVEMARARGFDAESMWDGDLVRTFFRASA